MNGSCCYIVDYNNAEVLIVPWGGGGAFVHVQFFNNVRLHTFHVRHKSDVYRQLIMLMSYQEETEIIKWSNVSFV